MASVGKHEGTYRVQFSIGRQRCAVRLPGADKRQAEHVSWLIQELVNAKRSGSTVPGKVAEGVGNLPDQVHSKLVKYGLTEPRAGEPAAAEVAPEPVGQFIDRYVSTRADVKPATVRVWRQTRNLLVKHFGDRCIRTVTALDARGFHSRLIADGFAQASVSKYTSFARQFFMAAIDAGILASNPFIRIRLGSRKNESRQRFIEWSAFQRIIDGTADPEFRLVLALARIGGLRIPSELQGLKWQHIDRAAGKILVHSPKTARHPGGESRTIPLFPELVPYINDWWERCPKGEEHVIPSNRVTESAWRLRLGRLLDRVGVPRWPRIFHNLRASRQTELEAKFATHIVCRWMGNSADVARKHYLQVRESDFQAAAEIPTTIPTTQASISANKHVKADHNSDSRYREISPISAGKVGFSAGANENRSVGNWIGGMWARMEAQSLNSWST